MYFRLKYGVSGMDKIITKDHYETLSFGDQFYYELVFPINCGANKEEKSREEIVSSAYEAAYAEYSDTGSLDNMMGGFYD